MSDNNKPKKKSGILAAIWESMTKTGGCCGSGESCGCGNKTGNGGNKSDKKSINNALPPVSDSGKDKK